MDLNPFHKEHRAPQSFTKSSSKTSRPPNSPTSRLPDFRSPRSQTLTSTPKNHSTWVITFPVGCIVIGITNSLPHDPELPIDHPAKLPAPKTFCCSQYDRPGPRSRQCHPDFFICKRRVAVRHYATL